MTDEGISPPSGAALPKPGGLGPDWWVRGECIPIQIKGECAGSYATDHTPLRNETRNVLLFLLFSVFLPFTRWLFPTQFLNPEFIYHTTHQAQPVKGFPLSLQDVTVEA